MISYNNLFYGTTNSSGNVTNTMVSIRHRSGTSSPNTNENNVFDGVTAVLDGTVGYNAYLHGGTNTTIQGTDIVTNLTCSGTIGRLLPDSNQPFVDKTEALTPPTWACFITRFALMKWWRLITLSAEVSLRGGRKQRSCRSTPMRRRSRLLEDTNGNGAVDSGEIDWLVAGDWG